MTDPLTTLEGDEPVWHASSVAHFSVIEGMKPVWAADIIRRIRSLQKDKFEACARLAAAVEREMRLKQRVQELEDNYSGAITKFDLISKPDI